MLHTRLTRRRFVGLVAGTAAYAMCLASMPAQAQAKRKIVITGSSTIAPLIQDIVHRFEKAHSDLRVDVQTGGTSRGVSDVRRKIAQIGMVSRALYPDEGDLARHLLARDGIALIVHKSNGIKALSDDQIRQIFRGEVTRWADMGGPPGSITVINKAEGRSTLEVFLAYSKLAVKDVKAHVVIGDNEQGVKVVASNPRAIGYISVGTAEYHMKVGTPLKMIPLGPVPASTETVANGTYAASRELNLVTLTGTLEPQVASFLTFALSKANHDLIREHFFVPPTR